MTTLATLRLGTRGSRLALAQAQLAAAALAASGFGERIELVEIETRGDHISQRRPRGRWEAVDGQFTTELEHALRAGEVDLVVHSYKDLPTAEQEDLVIGAILERGDPRDCLLSPGSGGLDGLAFGARVATSSPRRAAQLAAVRPDLVAVPIRGNVTTRLERLRRGEYDGLLLAACGLDRLGVLVREESRLALEVMLPAPAQAALAIQVRAGDGPLRAQLAAVDHRPTRIAVEAERALLRRIGGGCLAPLGALGEVIGGKLRLRATYEDGAGKFVRVDVRGPAAHPARVVARAAHQISRRAKPPNTKRVVVTRPVGQAVDLIALLAQRGIRATSVPTVTIEPEAGSLDDALARLDGADWLVITSPNGANAVLERLAAVGRRLPPETRVAAVGPATAKALEAGGMRVDHVPDDYLTAAIAAGLGDVAGQRVVLVRAEAATPDLRRSLLARHALVEEAIAYRTVEGPTASREPLRDALRRDVDGVTFTSGSTVRGFIALLGLADRPRAEALPAFCIGPVTADEARRAGLRVVAVAGEHTAAGLADAIADYFTKER